MYEYGMHGWGMMYLGWLVLIGLVIVFVYAFTMKRNGSAKEILDRRYASGEIDTKEYRERLKELGYSKDDETD